MITNSGARCDVCGEYILPLNPDELVNIFTVKQIPNRELHCDNKCRTIVENSNGDWRVLPPGPLRTVYEEATKQIRIND